MPDAVRFAKPPIVELIFGVQFSPLSRVTMAHLGWFWKQLGDDWGDSADGTALPDQFERFDRAGRPHPDSNFELRFGSAVAMNRIAISHQKRNRLLQIQSSQFRFHWRQFQEAYLGYDLLIQEFEDLFGRFAQFVAENRLGQLLPNQWDLTYVDAFPREDGSWHRPEDWATILPGLFGVPPVADGLVLDSRAASWSYVIGSNNGRLHISAQSQNFPGESRESLMLRLTARGPILSEKAPLRFPRDEFDLGHNSILKTFLRVTSPQLQANWGRKP